MKATVIVYIKCVQWDGVWILYKREFEKYEDLTVQIKIHFDHGRLRAWICLWGSKVTYLPLCSMKLKRLQKHHN